MQPVRVESIGLIVPERRCLEEPETEYSQAGRTMAHSASQFLNALLHLKVGYPVFSFHLNAQTGDLNNSSIVSLKFYRRYHRSRHFAGSAVGRCAYTVRSLKKACQLPYRAPFGVWDMERCLYPAVKTKMFD